ncbi:MAG: TonB-dependent receptor [Calditrichaeota bacterium]|nr:MAG: TonB-dependent receptor [Calditrichota bacterium]
MKHNLTIFTNLKLYFTAFVVFSIIASFQTVSANDSKYAEGTSTIIGKVVDSETGEPIIGATVQVDSTNLGAFTDLDGNFRIKKVPFGYYSLSVSSVGYEKAFVATIVVTADQKTVANILMHPTIYEANDITVKEKALINTEAMLLKQRQNANEITDAISSEEISRSGSSDAAEAMSKVTGATVVGGQYVTIRGMGDRYAQAKLNGSVLPSPDPDKQSVPMDMIPTALLDNIIVEKSFTPDKPGDFGGGSVNLATKDYPEDRTLTFSSSFGYNDVSTFNNMLTQEGSSTDWLGYDNGFRDIPDYVIDNQDKEDEMIEGKSFVRYQSGNGMDYDSVVSLASYVENVNESFRPEMIPTIKEAPMNSSYSVSYGDLHSLFDRPLGIVSSLSYSRKFSATEGFRGKYRLSGAAATALSTDAALNEQTGKEDVLWSGFMNLKYGIHTNHKLGFSYTRTQNGESSARYLDGEFTEHLDPGQTLFTNALSYKEREINVFQFNGEHIVLGQNRLHWNISNADSRQDEPDARFFTYYEDTIMVEDEDSGDLYPVVKQILAESRFRNPQRMWRDINEDKIDYSADLTIPISRTNKIKFGYLYQNTDRTYNEKIYRYTVDGTIASIENYLTNVGMIDDPYMAVYQGDTTIQFNYYNSILNLSEPQNQYYGYKKISAFYGMLEFALTSRLNIIGGLRAEKTDMFSETESDKYEPGTIKQTDYLPSIGLIFKTNTNMNLRASYGKTLARPTFKELTPATSQSFGVGREFVGNNEIKMTAIDMYDLRWEWFLRPGEILAISGFYKNLTNPIEHSIQFVNGGIKAVNSDNAEVYGAEVEFRRTLDHISPALTNFQLGGNIAIIKSSVKISDEEASFDVNTDKQTERPLEGQSPYVVNLDFGYNNRNTGSTISLFYNISGERLAYNAEKGTPDVYEQPRNQLDLIASQVLFGGPKFKLTVKNILNENSEFIHDDVGFANDYYFKYHEIGTSYSFGVSYNIW